MRILDACLLVATLGAFAVNAQAANSCASTGGSVSLGAYSGESATPTDSIGAFTLRCTRSGGPAAVTVTLGIGPSGNTASIASRMLKQATGTDLLAYNLYRDALRQNVWGETVGVNAASQTVNIPNNGTVNVTFNVYGRIPGLQSVHAGSYSDALVVTFTY